MRTKFFTVDATVAREDWLLVAGALEPYKRTELAVEAANRFGFELKVVGDGSQRRSLAAQAGPSVQLLGWVDQDALRDLFRRARGLLFPQVEDFGIAAVEAQACGCPVVAYRAGGVLDSVTPTTGVLFDEQTAASRGEAVDGLATQAIDPAACRANAERFSEEVFDRAMIEHARAMLT